MDNRREAMEVDGAVKGYSFQDILLHSHPEETLSAI